MKKRANNVNYNGEPLKPGEVLVLTPYDEEDAKANVTNADSIITITLNGTTVKAVLKAVPVEHEAAAKAQFNSWQREFLPKKSAVSLDQQLDENGYEPVQSPSVEAQLTEEEELTESQQRIIEAAAALMEKSPKHCLAMLLMCLGLKGESFAERMHLKHDAANRVRNQILSTAPNRISSFDQLDIDSFNAHKVGDTEYYRTEAKKVLETILKMYF